VDLIFYYSYLALFGVPPMLIAAGIMGLVANRRGHKYASGFGYGVLIGVGATIPWALSGGWVLFGLIGALFGVVGLVVLTKRKFPKVISSYQKRT
jgi:hypothetical protein